MTALEWVTAGSSVVGAVATAAAAIAAWRAATASSVAAERATQALALHNEPTLFIAVTQRSLTVHIDVHLHRELPRWVEVEWRISGAPRRSLRVSRPGSMITIPLDDAPASDDPIFEMLAVTARDADTDGTWQLTVLAPPASPRSIAPGFGPAQMSLPRT